MVEKDVDGAMQTRLKVAFDNLASLPIRPTFAIDTLWFRGCLVQRVNSSGTSDVRTLAREIRGRAEIAGVRRRRRGAACALQHLAARGYVLESAARAHFENLREHIFVHHRFPTSPDLCLQQRNRTETPRLVVDARPK